MFRPLLQGELQLTPEQINTILRSRSCLISQLQAAQAERLAAYGSLDIAAGVRGLSVAWQHLWHHA